ncbi:hypothetical protein ACOBQX_24690 [Actinokineospora sp. G85]|uniref:hypothetical protein n=1 Tax=Actinokineospora sp. G85 TaxID=3406626 RepID=UPI003C710B92
MARNKTHPKETATPILWQQPQLPQAHYGGYLLGLIFFGLSVFGLVRYPHWIWAAPILVSALALIANTRIRYSYRQIEALLLAVAVLACLIGAGLLTGLALNVAR